LVSCPIHQHDEPSRAAFPGTNTRITSLSSEAVIPCLTAVPQPSRAVAADTASLSGDAQNKRQNHFAFPLLPLLHFHCWVCPEEADVPRGINNQKAGPIKVPVRNPWSQPHKQKNAALLISLWLLATEKQNKLVPVRMRGMPRCLHARRCVEDVAAHGAGGYRPRGLDAVPEVVAVGGWVADVTERLLHSLPHGAAFFRCCGDYLVDDLRVLLEGAEGRRLGESRGGVRRFGHVDGFGVVGYDRGRFLG